MEEHQKNTAADPISTAKTEATTEAKTEPAVQTATQAAAAAKTEAQSTTAPLTEAENTIDQAADTTAPYKEERGKTEKLTVNVSAMDLAKIDLLVESMEYTNRSDFCRIAIREQLNKHKDDFERLHQQSSKASFDTKHPLMGGIGIIRLSESDLQEALQQNRQVNVMVTGMLLLDKSISPQLLDAAVNRIKVFGTIRAQPQLQKIIAQKRQGAPE